MIDYSGQNWYMRPSSTHATIQVIEPATGDGEDAHRERKVAQLEEKGARKQVPFGFARAREEA